MEQPRHVYTISGGEVRRLQDHFRTTGQFVVVHEHRKEQSCWGECLMLNIPDELETQLSLEV